MTRVEALGKEALELALYLLNGGYNNMQFYAATDRIHTICAEIGGNPRELMSNAQRLIDKQPELGMS